jgi:hypothetical protein
MEPAAARRIKTAPRAAISLRADIASQHRQLIERGNPCQPNRHRSASLLQTAERQRSLTGNRDRSQQYGRASGCHASTRSQADGTFGRLMVVARMPSTITPSELKQQLRLLGLSQRHFGHRCAVTSRAIEAYCANGSVVPGYIARLLAFEQLLHSLTVLVNASGERISKRRMQDVLRAADRAVTATPAPKRRKAKYRPRRRNYLSLKLLPRPRPADVLEDAATWSVLAERVGQDAARRLHERLAQRRPQSPRHGPDGSEPPRSRTTGPI